MGRIDQECPSLAPVLKRNGLDWRRVSGDTWIPLIFSVAGVLRNGYMHYHFLGVVLAVIRKVTTTTQASEYEKRGGGEAGLLGSQFFSSSVRAQRFMPTSFLPPTRRTSHVGLSRGRGGGECGAEKSGTFRFHQKERKKHTVSFHFLKLNLKTFCIGL